LIAFQSGLNDLKNTKPLRHWGEGVVRGSTQF